MAIQQDDDDVIKSIERGVFSWNRSLFEYATPPRDTTESLNYRK